MAILQKRFGKEVIIQLSYTELDIVTVFKREVAHPCL